MLSRKRDIRSSLNKTEAENYSTVCSSQRAMLFVPKHINGTSMIENPISVSLSIYHHALHIYLHSFPDVGDVCETLCLYIYWN